MGRRRDDAVERQHRVEELRGIGACPHGDHRRPHRGDVVAGRPLERRLGQPELEIQPGFEQVQGVRGGRLKPQIQRPHTDLRGRAGDGDPAARSRPNRHQIAITQDAQRLVHHRRADAEPVHDLRAAPEVRANRKATLRISCSRSAATRSARENRSEGSRRCTRSLLRIAAGAAVAPRRQVSQMSRCGSECPDPPANIARYGRTRRIQFVEIPKTISGGIRRVDLLTHENSGEPSDLVGETPEPSRCRRGSLIARGRQLRTLAHRRRFRVSPAHTSAHDAAVKNVLRHCQPRYRQRQLGIRRSFGACTANRRPLADDRK